VPVSGYVVLAFKGKKMQKSINFIFVKGMQMTADFAFFTVIINVCVENLCTNKAMKV